MAAKKDKEETRKRREEIKDFMETVGPYSLPIKQLAKNWNCELRTIYNDRNFWLKKLDFKKIELEGRRIIMGMRNSASIIEGLKLHTDPMIQLKAIVAGNQTGEVLTKILENYGFKEKVADKLEYTGKIFQVTREVVDARRDSESKDEDGSKAGTSLENSKG